MLDCLRCHHLTHICSTGRIPDHSSTAPDQSNRLIASLLQSLHQAQCHKMSNMQTIRRRIKPNIKRSLPVIHQIPDKRLIRNLRNQSSGLKLFINTHFSTFLSFSKPISYSQPIFSARRRRRPVWNSLKSSRMSAIRKPFLFDCMCWRMLILLRFWEFVL